MNKILNYINAFMDNHSELIGSYTPKERMMAALFITSFWVAGVLNFILLFIHEGDPVCIILGFIVAFLLKRRYFRGKTQGTILDIALSEFTTTF